ncbi:BatD family protein [Chelatococcus reniformis]|uniref:DUF7939 domain-containing protein n=1 Tax=Chelatococcus reniformis TaxID=1494448 RepID=A0A916UP03_9HYPH|nr:BatD family protein [Chelatococcus reniformis]GGC81424.1 hypothetical protein GCM10010994_44250 [Chelatococcus reniformis]
MDQRRRITGLAAALALALALAASGPAMAATLTGAADQTTVDLGKTIRYVVRLSGAGGNAAPDWTPLTRDFDIVDQRQQRRATAVNGRRAETVEWTLTLAPKAAGKLTIPPLTVAALRTAPVAITVNGGAADQALDGALSVRIEVGKAPIYVQSDVPIVLRVHDALGIRDGSFGDLSADGATITPQGRPGHRFETIKGRKYHIIEQNYVMRPQRSGQIEIRPVTVEANVPTGNGLLSSTDPQVNLSSAPLPLSRIIDPGRDVTLRSPPVLVEVKARPAAIDGWFLPARGVTLTDTWSSPLTTAKVGEALTRTIRLEARGASPNQLPAITPADADGVRQYEEASRSDAATIKGEAAAVLVKTVSVVPTRAGEVTLPAVEVEWWNIDGNRPERAVLPAETFTVAPDVSATAAAPPPAAEIPAASPDASETTEPRPGRLLALLAMLVEQLGATRVGAGLAAAIAMAGVAWWLPRRLARAARRPQRAAVRSVSANAPTAPVVPAPAAELSAQAAERALKAACRANDAAATYRAFLVWARLDTGPPARPAEAMRSAEMRRAVDELQRHLYGGPPGGWTGKGFLTALRAEQQARRRRERRPRGARLLPLYPEAGAA